MKYTFLPLLALSAAALLGLAGCSTDAHYVDPAGSRAVTEVGRINVQDFANAADTMVNSLIDSIISQDKLKSGAPGEPALMAISRVQNSTGQQFDTDQLVKKIRIQLLKTGKVQTSTTISLGETEDPLAAQNNARPADYTLSGKIIEDRAQSGKLRQSAFIFQLSLSSRAGVAIWEEEKTIIKQGTRPSVGF